MSKRKRDFTLPILPKKKRKLCDGDLVYMCTGCDRGFLSQQAISKHTGTNSRNKNYKCVVFPRVLKYVGGKYKLYKNDDEGNTTLVDFGDTCSGSSEEDVKDIDDSAETQSGGEGDKMENDHVADFSSEKTLVEEDDISLEDEDYTKVQEKKNLISLMVNYNNQN